MNDHARYGSETSHGFIEDIVEREARKHGVVVQEYAVAKSGRDMFSGNRLVLRVPYETIYSTKSASHVLLSAELEAEVRVECHWQVSSGSVDQKLPYMFFNARDKMPEQWIVLVVDGGGARPEAIRWLRRECATVRSKRIEVMNLPEYQQWCRRFVRADRTLLASSDDQAFF